ncbi:hypothetical protein C8R47DRAFT_1194823 [Mycena vitilis]|nr:hypothetical protein C8R47DRAFT_1194823 [Mycena vitilis]
MSAAYTPLPTSAGYPPPQSHTILSRLTPQAPPTRIRRLLAFIAVLSLSSTLLVYLVFSPFSLSGFTTGSSTTSSSDYYDDDYAESGGDGPSSPFFRDTHPALHARLFLARAQAEIKARGLNTCNGQLGARMVDAYIDNAVSYCGADDSPTAITCFPAGRAAPKDTPNAWWPYPQAFCASNQLTHATGWGGNVPARGTFAGQCAVSDDGERLKADMGREVFLGKEFVEGGEGECGEVITHPVLFIHRQDRWNPFHVGEDLVTTFLALTLFSRQPSSPLYSASTEHALWTSLSSSYASNSPAKFKKQAQALAAQLTHTQDLQLVFQDEHLPAASPFAPLYDRLGAFPPRRTAAEGLGEGGRTCFARAFHSVGAGASLLSATGVGREHRCASELVWGASLWLRWGWGFEGVGVPGGGGGVDGVGVRRRGGGEEGSEAEKKEGESEEEEAEVGEGEAGEEEENGEVREEMQRRAPIAGGRASTEEPIQVLFLSREKYDAYTRHTNHKLSPWQEARHIQNEAELRAGLRAGLAGLCRVVTDVVGGPAPDTQSHTPGSYDCAYTDADALPGAWGVRMHAREARALGVRASRPASDPDSEASEEKASGGGAEAGDASEGLGAGGGGGEVGAGGGDGGEGSANDRRVFRNATHPHALPFRTYPSSHPPSPDSSSRSSNRTKRALKPRALRFATLDPTTSALPAQLGAVGRADVVVSVHAGALGLTLFMPTGRASVVELITDGAQGGTGWMGCSHGATLAGRARWMHAPPSSKFVCPPTRPALLPPTRPASALLPHTRPPAQPSFRIPDVPYALISAYPSTRFLLHLSIAVPPFYLALPIPTCSLPTTLSTRPPVHPSTRSALPLPEVALTPVLPLFRLAVLAFSPRYPDPAFSTASSTPSYDSALLSCRPSLSFSRHGPPGVCPPRPPFASSVPTVPNADNTPQNWHFHNMAHMMGMEYVRIGVQKNVDVGRVVRAVRDIVEERLRK